MKKFWKINLDNDYKNYIKKLKIDDKDFLEFILEFKEVAQNFEHDYIFISVDDLDEDYHCRKWCWGSETTLEIYINKDYIYGGEVNLRKEKLIKLNEIHT